MNKKVSLSFKIFLILFVFIAIFVIRFGMLQKSNFFNGMDGCFYGVQADSFAKRGFLADPDFEVGYYCCGILSFIFQNSIIGVKVWASFAFALFCISIFSLVYSIVNNKKFFYALSAMLLVSGTFFSTSFSVNYINNLTGLVFLIFYVQLFISLFNGKWNRKKIITIVSVILLFILAYLSHKVSFIYAVAFSVIFIFSKFSRFLENKKVLTGFICEVVLLIVVAVHIFVKQSARFVNTFGFPSLPVFHHNFILSFGSMGLYCAIELSVYFVIGWLVFLTDIILSRKIKLEYFVFIILFFPFWNLDSDMGFRMIINGTILGIPLIIFMCSNILTGLENITKNIYLSVFSFLGFISLLFSPSAYDPKNDPPYSYYKEVVKNINLPKDSLLIAHLGLNHVYSYYKEFRDCLNWLPEYEIDEEKVWRLAYGVDADYIKTYFYDISEENLSQWMLPIDSQYILIKEQLWNLYLKREDPEISETFKNWFNPYEVRPSYIRDN